MQFIPCKWVAREAIGFTCREAIEPGIERPCLVYASIIGRFTVNCLAMMTCWLPYYRTLLCKTHERESEIGIGMPVFSKDVDSKEASWKMSLHS